MFLRKRNLERLLDAAFKLGYIAATQEAIAAVEAQDEPSDFVTHQRRVADCQ